MWHSGQLSSRRVLVVDDNRDAADSLGKLLNLAGAEARAVYNGATALEVLPTYQPAVLLVDIGMPDMDGCASNSNAQLLRLANPFSRFMNCRA